jgi:tRNA threonylcarbamoyladenosine biosynthesis protein TsaB
MRILAIETSSTCGCVAALENDRVLGETAFDPAQRTAQSFAPAIDAQLREVGWRPQQVQLVAVTEGPGSFTGLRVGITAAKTLAYAVGAEVIGVNTLKVIAWQTPGEVSRVWAVLDAQRQQLFAAQFARDQLAWLPLTDTRIVDHSDWLAGLSGNVAVTGLGLKRVLDRIPPDVLTVDASHWSPRAATVGVVGHLEYREGKRDDLWKLNPRYYRRSAAEEKVDARR